MDEYHTFIRQQVYDAPKQIAGMFVFLGVLFMMGFLD